MFDEVEHLIKELIENIGKIRQNREINSSSVKEQKRIIESAIQELRTKINTHLDKLQEDLIKEMTEAVKQETEETHELLVSLDEKQKELTEFNSQGFDSTTTSPNFLMLFAIVFRSVSILHDRFACFKLSPLSSDCKRGYASQDVLFFQMVEWYCPLTVRILSALSTKKELNYFR
jgi:hypothetical protein